MSRKSKQKDSILRVLRGTTCHPGAEWIYGQVRQEIPRVSLGTIYRNLKSLKRDGEIVELDSSGTVSRFDGNTGPHYHFRCEQCDRIFDVSEPVNRTIDSRVARETGFKVSHHRLEFRGLCKDCQT